MRVPFVSFDRFAIDWHGILAIGIMVVLACLGMFAFGYGVIVVGEWFHQFENPELVAQWCADTGSNSTRCK